MNNSIIELVKAIPQLLDLFIPGFVFLSIYRFFIGASKKDAVLFSIWSIVISYILSLITAIIGASFNLPNNLFYLISTAIAIVLAPILVKLRMTSFCRKLFILIGKTSGNESIWYDFFDIYVGTSVRFKTKYDDRCIEVTGVVFGFDTCDNGECIFILKNYTIVFENGDKYEGPHNTSIMFNTKDVFWIEAQKTNRKKSCLSCKK